MHRLQWARTHSAAPSHRHTWESRTPGSNVPMVGFLNFPTRSIHRLFWHIIILLGLSITTCGQSQNIILGVSLIQNSLDHVTSGMADAFPVTANSSGQVHSLSLFLDSSNTAATVWVGIYTSYYGHPSRLLSQAVISQPVLGTMELGDNSCGASDARKTLLGCIAGPEWPD
jgi:hypothetical protein